jgi:ectoine hydroxylase-related dioxygenase (phytanoyl-CoA dioxygenase family)
MLDVTGDQIARFNEDGFLIVERIVDKGTVVELRDAYDRMFRREFETGVWPDEVNWQEGTGDPSPTRQICNGWRGSRAIALDDTSAEGGTLEFVRGSHRWDHRPPEGEFHGPHEYQKYMRLAAQREGVEPEIVPVVVPKGGGSFHHGWTWHGSGYNRSERPRRSLVLHAMRSDTRYVPEHLSEGTGRIYSRYKRLTGDEIDENYFPVLWRQDGYRTPGIDRYLAAG